MKDEKNIKHYLNLYLGCECRVEESNLKWKLTAVQSITDICVLRNNVDSRTGAWLSSEKFKLVLRPLSDMTDEEKCEFIDLCFIEPEDISCLEKSIDDFFPDSETSFGTAHLTNIAQWAIGVKYLLSKDFDLFGLIEAGLAIDKTKMIKQ